MTLSARLRPLIAAVMFAGIPLAMTACQSPGAVASTTVSLPLPEMPGHAFAARTCAGCHAIERTGDSPHPDALPFRRISSLYPVRDLEEAFAEGIFVGHPDMPPFQLAPEEIDDLLDYLEAIQDPI